MSGEVTIRQAIREDVPAVTGIYNHAILHSTATFDTVEKTLEDRCAWFGKHTDAFPLLVATVGDRVVGWASMQPFGRRRAYHHTVESSVYVDVDHQGRGIGKQLLGELLAKAREQGHHVVLAQVVGGNEASKKLHEGLGFSEVGVMREVGRKLDQWLDVVVYEFILSERVED